MNDKETANEFNKAFHSVFIKELDGELPNPDDVPEQVPKLEDLTVTELEGQNMLKSLNVDKAMGPDNIHPKLLQECHKELALPVLILINRSVYVCEVPSLWKVAKVCPLLKKGDKLVPLNYRPVSLACMLCKLCERLIKAKLVKRLAESMLLRDEQHGFRQRRSTLTNLLVYMDNLTAAVGPTNPC